MNELKWQQRLGKDWPARNFENWRVGGSNLLVCNLEQAEIRNSYFIKCEIRTCEASEVVLENCIFDKCNLENNVLIGAVMKNVQFNNCTLSANSFVNNRWEAVRFSNCEFGYNGLTGIEWNGLAGLTLEKHGDFVWNRDSDEIFHKLVQGHYSSVRSALAFGKLPWLSEVIRKELEELYQCSVKWERA